MTRVFAAALSLAVLAAACGSNADTTATVEVSRAQAGDVTVVLLSDDGTLSQQGNRFVVEFRSVADGALVDVGHPKASAMMPMPGMGPMFGDVALEPTGEKGRFLATGDFSMAGSWRLSLDWEGPEGSGSTTLTTMVR